MFRRSAQFLCSLLSDRQVVVSSYFRQGLVSTRRRKVVTMLTFQKQDPKADDPVGRKIICTTFKVHRMLAYQHWFLLEDVKELVNTLRLMSKFVWKSEMT